MGHGSLQVPLSYKVTVPISTYVFMSYEVTQFQWLKPINTPKSHHTVSKAI